MNVIPSWVKREVFWVSTFLLVAIVALSFGRVATAEEEMTIDPISVGGLVSGDWELLVNVSGNFSSVTYRIDRSSSKPLDLRSNDVFGAMVDTTLYVDGPHEVTVSVWGAQPGPEIASSIIPITIDNSPPIIWLDMGPERVVYDRLEIRAVLDESHLNGTVVILMVEGEIDRVLSLEPSTEEPGTFLGNVTTRSLSNATYNFTVEAIDALGNVGTSATKTFQVRWLPDLIVSSFRVIGPTEHIRPGQTLEVRYEIMNVGIVPVGGIHIEFREDANHVSSFLYNNTLGVNDSFSGQFEWRAGQEGRQRLRVFVDHNNDIKEVSEVNNRRGQTVDVEEEREPVCNSAFIVGILVVLGIVAFFVLAFVKALIGPAPRRPSHQQPAYYYWPDFHRIRFTRRPPYRWRPLLGLSLLALFSLCVVLEAADTTEGVTITDIDSDGLVAKEWVVRVTVEGNVSKVSLIIDGDRMVPMVAETAGTYVSTVDSSRFADGVHTVRVEAYGTTPDAIDSATFSVEVDNSPPKLSVAWEPEDVAYNHLSVVVAVNETHMDGTQVCVIVDDNKDQVHDLSRDEGTSNFTGSIDVRELVRANHSFVVYALDPLGNLVFAPPKIIEVRSAPDLVVTSVVLPEGDRVWSGDILWINFTVENRGVAESGPFKVRVTYHERWAEYRPSGRAGVIRELFVYEHNGTLGVNGSVLASVGWLSSGEAIGNVQVQVDPDDEVPESNETNNIGPLRDLTIDTESEYPVPSCGVLLALLSLLSVALLRARYRCKERTVSFGPR